MPGGWPIGGLQPVTVPALSGQNSQAHTIPSPAERTDCGGIVEQLKPDLGPRRASPFSADFGCQTLQHLGVPWGPPPSGL